MSVRLEHDGAVLMVTIDRPRARNALSLQMSRELAAAWTELRDDPRLRVAVLTGAGEAAFCAGADLKEVGAWYRSMTPLERRRHGEREPGLGGLTRNLDPGKPVLAAINGACLAGGLELALACDLRIAAHGVQFGMPPAKLGLVYSHTGIRRFIDAIGVPRARELFLVGRRVSPQTALEWGLVNDLVDADALEESALGWAAEIAGNAPLSVRGNKQVFRALLAAEGSVDEATERELVALREACFSSHDMLEGVRAFSEKREPRWQGR